MHSTHLFSSFESYFSHFHPRLRCDSTCQFVSIALKKHQTIFSWLPIIWRIFATPIINVSTLLWLAKWCKIHKVYIHLHSMLLLLFTNIFIHIQQPNLHSRNIFIHIYRCISYSRLYLLTFTRCLHSRSTCHIHSHSRWKYSFSIFCAPPLRIIRS